LASEDPFIVPTATAALSGEPSNITAVINLLNAVKQHSFPAGD